MQKSVKKKHDNNCTSNTIVHITLELFLLLQTLLKTVRDQSTHWLLTNNSKQQLEYLRIPTHEFLPQNDTRRFSETDDRRSNQIGKRNNNLLLKHYCKTSCK